MRQVAMDSGSAVRCIRSVERRDTNPEESQSLTLGLCPNRSGGRAGIWIVLLFCAAGQTSGQTSPTPSPVSDDEFKLPLDSTTAAEVDRYIVLLGSPEYRARQEATEGLFSVGAAAFSKLRDAYAVTDDFEVRARIEAIVREAYFEHHVHAHFGFLGITQDGQFTPGSEEDPRIPQGHVGIRIRAVLPETGAERAGLQMDDIIVEFDGRPIQGAGMRAVQFLGQAIKSRGPGSRVKIMILRGPQVMEVEAVLGRPPIDTFREGRLRNLSILLEEHERQFAIWWPKYFRK